MKKIQSTILVLVLIIISASVFADSDKEGNNGYKFYVDDPMNRNTVTFKSEAPLEDIVGTSNKITGFIIFDPDNPQKGGTAELSVPISSLNTGIPLRDEHLHSPDWLNAEKYQNITLKIDEVKDAKLIKEMDNSRTFELTVSGKFNLNGKSGQIEFPARVTFLKENDMTKMKLPGNLLAVRTNFDVALADYKVTGPDNMPIIGAKVSKEIHIDINLIGSTTLPSLTNEKM